MTKSALKKENAGGKMGKILFPEVIPMLTHLQFVDRLTVIFSLVDDLLKALPLSAAALPNRGR